MDRRYFLETMAMAAIAGGVSSSITDAAAASESWQRSFAAAQIDDPWLIGFANVATDRLETRDLVVEGTLPGELRGTFYRNGPAGHERGDRRYHHWFDGDGMVQAIRFGDDGVSHVGRFVQTAKRLREIAAQRFVYPTFGTVPADPEPIANPDAINPANINVVAHGGELLALWEAGSAHRMDPSTLDTLGVKTWRDDLAGMPFSAHPKIEPDGTLWNFGLSLGRGTLVIYRIDAGGTLEDVGLVEVGEVGMLHDVAVSAHHLIFLLQPLLLDPERLEAGRSFLDSHVWRPERGTRVLTVAKDDLASARWYDLPAGFLFHFGNAFEEPSGMIHFDYCRYPDPSVMTSTLREVMRGRHVETPSAQTVLATLDPTKGTARSEALTPNVEFPRVDPRVVARRHRQLYTVAATGGRRAARFGFDSVVRHDLETGALDVYRYGDMALVEEHIVVPRPGSSREGDGWLIGTALDVERQATVVSVFAASNLAAGPMATIRLPYVLPLGFHGNFVAA